MSNSESGDSDKKMGGRNKLVSHHTVLVVGAGPAGVAAAQRLAENKIDVKVIEKRTIIGNPAQCGECVPKWGEVLGTFPRITDDVWLEKYFDFPDYIIAQDLKTLRVFTPKMKVYGFKLDCFSSHRVQFDGLLAEMAKNAGAKITMNTALTKILKRKNNSELYVTSNGRFTADYVIDASGSLAHVARLRGSERPKNLVPTLYAQCQGDFSPSFDVYIGNMAPGGYAWVIPKGKIANVGLGVDPRRCKADLKELLNEFVEKLGLEILSYGGGWIPMGGPISKLVNDNVLSVGDSAGLVMPTNGGGIGQAIVSGKLAADSIISNIEDGVPLNSYEKKLKFIMQKPLKISLRSNKIFTKIMYNELLTEVSLRMLGPLGGIRRAMECKRPMWIL